MATEILTKSYQGNDLSGMTSGVIYVPISYDSTILAIKVKTDLNVEADAEFVLTNLDGTGIAGTSLTIESGTKKGVLTALEITRPEDADVLLKLVSGAVSSPITLVLVVSDDTFSDTTPALSDLLDVVIDDPQTGDALVFDGANWVNQPGGTGGASLPTGDLNAATNKLEKIQGRSIYIPGEYASIDDSFADNSLVATQDNVSFDPGTNLGDGDLGKLFKGSAAAGFVTYEFAAAEQIILTYFRNVGVTNVSPVIAVSADGIDYTDLVPTTTSGETDYSGGWKKITATYIGLTGANFVKLTLPATTFFYSPVASRILISRVGAVTDKTLFWFNEAANRFETATLEELKAALDALP